MSDYISRQAAIDAIRGWVNKAFEDWGNAGTEIRCFNAIYPLIMALPSAQLTQTNTDSTQDCISRQAAIDKVDRIVEVNHLNPDMVWFTPNGVKTLMEDLPFAQPEIIRCKDCKQQVKEWRDDKRLKDKSYWVYGCKLISDVCGYWAGFGQDDGFCSEAERRTDEGD